MPNLIDSQAIWSLRPEDIPGQIMRRSAGNDESIRIKPEVGLNGPDGNLLSEAEFIKIGSLPRVDVGQLVLFRIAKAGQQFYIDRLRVISSAEDRIRYNNVKQEFRSSYAARIETLVSDLGTKVEELATSRADAMMVSEREAIDKAWLEHNANVEVHNANVETHNRDRQSLELASSAFSTDRICLDTEKQEFQHAKQELEQGKLDFQQAGGEALLKLVRQSQVSNAENVETPDRLQDESDVAPKGLIKSLGGYFQSQNYSVDDPLLLQALLCLCVGAATGQFIVLTGPPGSGKTSLVGKIAQAIGAGSGVVPVRPAWIDATDLIGFYNPDINRYQPTPFLDNVLQAKRYDDLNRLYLLVLDEMNLGRVENYAADFLSLLEKAREGDRNAELQLYSREIKNRFKAEQEKYDASDNRTLEVKAHELLYPSRLPFPKGLVLLGTINVDETTHLPSPKFLDRSLTIQVSGTKLPEDLGKSIRTSNKVTSVDFSWALSLATAQRCLEEGIKLNSKAQETWKLLMKWNEHYFKPLGIRLSHRLPQVYRCYMGAAATLKISDHQQVADTFVLSKIMPLITFRDGDASETPPQESKRDVLKRWRDGKDKSGTVKMDMTEFPLVLAALEAMLARPDVIVRYLE